MCENASFFSPRFNPAALQTLDVKTKKKRGREESNAVQSRR